jgi:arylsulfatase A-like enzyme
VKIARLLASVWLVSLAACAPEATSVIERPNIVVIIGDDHDYRDFGFMGSELARTPHLDRLAASGMVFDVTYSTASVCRPSLRTLLTGLHPLEYRMHEVQLHRDRRLNPDASLLISALHTLPSRLAEVGYQSFQAGKYWEGPFGDAGFSSGMTAEAGRPSRNQAQRSLVRHTIEPVAEFVEQHASEPFLLWFAPMLPHLPHNPPPEHLEPYRESELSPAERKYYASVTWFDAGVGSLLKLLDRHGLTDRTLIVYLADNGWYPDRYASNVVLGGPHGKLSLYERGFRTPLILSWPGHIPVGVRDDLVSTEDLFPTLLGFAGAHPLADRLGIDLRPYIESGRGVPREALVGAMEGIRQNPNGTSGFFVRTRKWRYLIYEQGHDELYRIDRDPLESEDVAGSNPAVVRQMRSRISAWEAGIRAASVGRFRVAFGDASGEGANATSPPRPSPQPSQRM